LGVRFTDALDGRFVADGLSVTAYPEGQPALAKRSVANRSAVHTFHDLPGLPHVDVPEPAAVSASVPRLVYRIEVIDDVGRYLPFSLQATLPQQGLFELACAPPGPAWSAPAAVAGTASIALFSAPARRLAASFARVRAELWDAVRLTPAAWAVVEARAGDGLVQRGMSDELGRLALFFSYPEPVDLAAGSASSAFPLAPPLLEQTWPLELRVYYAPEQPVARIPDLCRKLSQPLAAVWADSARSERLGSLELKFGRELTVRTDDGGVPLSTLWVTSA
jgi:hypothetical protein